MKIGFEGTISIGVIIAGKKDKESDLSLAPYHMNKNDKLNITNSQQFFQAGFSYKYSSIRVLRFATDGEYLLMPPR